MPSGRFAPSPTGALHLGNLRTALVAWLAARVDGSRFVVRMEDLDPVTSSVAHERAQLDDLRAIGLDWDGEVLRQSRRFARYDEAIAELTEHGLTYPCTCTRREITEAARAPQRTGSDRSEHAGRYPGTCRRRSRAEQQAATRSGRPAALRLRSDLAEVRFVDRLVGTVTGFADDIVLRRNDGIAAYHLAVVVDDADQGVEQVVRGDDLLTSTPSQIQLGRLLGLTVPEYLHVPLVLGPDGARLAKRDGAVTLADRTARGETPAGVLRSLATSLGLVKTGETTTSASALLGRFEVSKLPRTPWTMHPDELG